MATQPFRAGKGCYLPKNPSALEALNWTVGSEGCGAGAAGAYCGHCNPTIDAAALDSEDTSFFVCRSLQGQVEDLLQEDYRSSSRWVVESYHERGREAVVEHELQNGQLFSMGGGGQQKQSNDPGNNQHILNTPIIGRR